MSHSASDGIGNRLYLLIPLALSFSLSLSLALSHSTPPLIRLLRTFLNISPNPIFLSRRLPAFSFSQLQSFYRPFLSSLLDSPILSCTNLFFFKTSNFHRLREPPLGPSAAWMGAHILTILPIHLWDIKKEKSVLTLNKKPEMFGMLKAHDCASSRR